MRAPCLARRARRPARGGPERRHIRLRTLTRPACRDRGWRALAPVASWVREPAAARSPKHPKISPSVPALFDERVERRCAGLGARRLSAEERLGRLAAPWPHEPVADEPRQPFVLFAFVVPRYGFKARDGTSPIDDEHRGAALEPVD